MCLTRLILRLRIAGLVSLDIRAVDKNLVIDLDVLELHVAKGAILLYLGLLLGLSNLAAVVGRLSLGRLILILLDEVALLEGHRILSPFAIGNRLSLLLLIVVLYQILLLLGVGARIPRGFRTAQQRRRRQKHTECSSITRFLRDTILYILSLGLHFSTVIPSDVYVP